MDDKKLISVIIPVYNAEKHLERSIKSVLDQTYATLEVILIDDGSTDESGRICDAFAKKDSRVKVIHKANGGQSDARNCGLDIATGDYIGFVDADDSVALNIYEVLLDNMIKEDAQISCCGTEQRYPDGGTALFNDDTFLYKVFTKEEALKEFTNNRIITASLWDKLFDKRIFDGLRLKKGMIFEDFQIMPYCLLRADMIVYSGKPLYSYNVTAVSTIRGHCSTKLFDIVTVCAELVELYRKECPDGLPAMENHYIDRCLSLYYLSHGLPEWNEKRKILLKILSSADRNTVADLYWDNRIKLKLINADPERYVRLYGMFQRLKSKIGK